MTESSTRSWSASSVSASSGGNSGLRRRRSSLIARSPEGLVERLRRRAQRAGDRVLAVGERHEPGLVWGRRRVDAALQQRAAEAGVRGGVAGGRLREVARSLRGEEWGDEARGGDDADLSLPRRLAQALGEAVGELAQALVRRGVELRERRQARRGRQRVPRQRPR